MPTLREAAQAVMQHVNEGGPTCPKRGCSAIRDLELALATPSAEESPKVERVDLGFFPEAIPKTVPSWVYSHEGHWYAERTLPVPKPKSRAVELADLLEQHALLTERGAIIDSRSTQALSRLREAAAELRKKDGSA